MDKLLALREMADAWDAMASQETDAHRARRETLRECADGLRMMLDLEPPSCPYAAPFAYCEMCKVEPCPIGLGQMRGGQ